MIRAPRNRAVAASAATVASLLALTACAGGGGGSPSSGPLLMYTWVGSENDRAQWDSYIAIGKEVDPDLDVTFEGPSFADYWTKVKTRLSGDNPPCLLTTQGARAKEMTDLLLPLDDLIAENDFDTSEIDASMLNGMTVDGGIRGIPYDAEPIVLYYNADRYEEAGLELPGVEYSREQFLSDLKTLSTPERPALAIEPGIFYPSAWATAGGAAWLDADGELDLTNPEFAEQVQEYFDLSATEGVARAPGVGETFEVGQQLFTSGEADLLMEGPWMYGAFDEAADFTLGMTIIPTPDGQARGMTSGSGFGIAANCDRPEEAFQAVVALTSAEVNAAQARDRGIVPARVSELAAWGEGKGGQAADVIAALLGNAEAQQTTTTWNQVETLFDQYGVEGSRGDKTAVEILETIQNQVQG